MSKGKDEGKPKVHEAIAKHEKLYSHAKILSDTAKVAFDKGYLKAVDKHITKDGQVDYKLLDDDDVQKKFADTMIDMYQKAATKYFGVTKDLGEVEKGMLMRAYLGTTENTLRTRISQLGKKFDSEQFSVYKDQSMQEVTSQLYQAAASHIKDEHAEAIVKHIPTLEDRVEGSKLNAQEATRLHRIFIEEGVVSDSVLKQVVPSYKRKKKGAGKKK